MGIENIELLINEPVVDSPSPEGSKTKVFVKRPMSVNAVQVTEENMKTLAEWCGGEIRVCEARPNKPDDKAYSYIKVPVVRFVHEKHTWARVGDWILQNRANLTLFKVYSPNAFRHDFHYDWWHPENSEEGDFGQVVGADPEASGQDDTHISSRG